MRSLGVEPVAPGFFRDPEGNLVQIQEADHADRITSCTATATPRLRRRYGGASRRFRPGRDGSPTNEESGRWGVCLSYLLRSKASSPVMSSADKVKSKISAFSWMRSRCTDLEAPPGRAASTNAAAPGPGYDRVGTQYGAPSHSKVPPCTERTVFLDDDVALLSLVQQVTVIVHGTELHLIDHWCAGGHAITSPSWPMSKLKTR